MRHNWFLIWTLSYVVYAAIIVYALEHAVNVRRDVAFAAVAIAVGIPLVVMFTWLPRDSNRRERLFMLHWITCMWCAVFSIILVAILWLRRALC